MTEQPIPIWKAAVIAELERDADCPAAQAADVAAEALRQVNHLTLNHLRELYPQDACEILGAIAYGVDRLPQGLEQLARSLAWMSQGGRRLRRDDGGDPNERMAAAVTALLEAKPWAVRLAGPLKVAQRSLNDVAVVDEEEG